MIVVLGILTGAIIVAMIWVYVYFNNEIADLRRELRIKVDIPRYYKPPNYSSYSNKKEECEEDQDEEE